MFLSPSAEGYTFAVGPQNMEELRVMPLYSVMSRQIFFIWTRSHFSYLLFSNPTHKTKIGTANMWEIISCKTPGAVIMIGQSETGRSTQLILILLFSIRCEALLCCVPPALANVLKKMLGQIHFIEPNEHVLTFLHPILICRLPHTEHIGGVALSFIKALTIYKSF